MAKHKLDREEIMSFLLGELEEAETSRIESMFLSDPTYSEAIEAAKSQLYEEYKSGRLSPAQSGRFERELLPDLDEDKKKFQAMLDRNEELRKAGEAGKSAAKSAGKSNAAAVANAAASKSSGSALTKLIVVAVLAAIGAAGAVVVMKGNGEEKSQASVTLPIFSVRGQSQLIVLPAGAEILLVLPLPADTNSQTFSLTAYSGDREEAWSTERVGDAVQTRVKRAALLEGRYDLELRASDGAEAATVGFFSFQK